MKVVLASRNKHKIGELQALLSKHVPTVEVLSLDDIGFEGDIEENGVTFEENAYAKAYAVAKMGYIGLGDDSGLSVRALGGAPGIYSARYAGEHGNDELNNRLLLESMKGAEDRKASFVCCIACAFPDEREDIVVNGYIHGEILHSPRGNNGFGYDPLFYSSELGKTLAEADASEKNLVSHRSNALKAFAEEFKKTLKNTL